MNRKKRFFLLVAPCLLLFGFAAFWQFRERSKGPPSFEIDTFEFQSSARPGYDTDVVMSLYARGTWPDDIIDPHPVTISPGSKVKEPYYAMGANCDFYYLQSGRWKRFVFPTNTQSIVYAATNYNRQEQRFVNKWSINTAAIPADLKPVQCRVQVIYYDDAHRDYKGAAQIESRMWLRPPMPNQTIPPIAP